MTPYNSAIPFLTITLICGAQSCLAIAARIFSRIIESPAGGGATSRAMLARACIRLARLTMPTMRPPRVTGSRFTWRRSISSTTASSVSNCPRAEGHDLLDLSARAMGVLLGKFARSDDKFEPLWTAPLGREFAAAEKIAFSDDPDQFTFLVHHRQAADAILQH